MLKYLLLLLISTQAFAEHIVSKEAGIDINTKKVIHVTGEVNEKNMARAAKEGYDTQGLPGDRVIIIKSNGGRVDIGEAFIKEMLSEKAHNHTRMVCVADGYAYSMGFNILSFCDVRLATPGTDLLAHKIRLESFPKGLAITAKNLRKLADDMDEEDAIFRVQNASAMNMSLKDYDYFADGEVRFSVQSLIKIGYLHGTATITKD